MIPFLSTADVLFAFGVVFGVLLLAGTVYALAWRQRPAMVAAKVAEAEAPVVHGAAADARLTASA